MREPMWLTAAADQRLALMADKLDPRKLNKVTVIMTPLTEPAEFATKLDMEFWDKSCDNCGKHCPTSLLCGQVDRHVHGIKVCITFGACRACAEAD